MERGAQCAVVLLVPDETGTMLLGRLDALEGALSLPVGGVDVGADTTRIVAEVRSLVGAAPAVLRMCTLAWTDQFDPTVIVVETEPMAGGPPRDHGWAVVPAQRAAEVHPQVAQPLVDRWIHERVHGLSDARAPWARQHWWEDAVAWALAATDAAGLQVVGAPELWKIWGISIVLRIPVRDGAVYVKSSCEAFRAEAGLTAALAGWAPSVVPEVIAFDADAGRLLMRDLGGVSLDEEPGAWAAGLEAMADLQRLCTAHATSLLATGAQDRPLTTLAEEAVQLERHDDLMSRLPEETRRQWPRAARRVADACLLLDELGPAPTLVHGDLHPGNMVLVDGRVRIFDWTDAAVAHPFVDLATFLRAADEADRPGLLDAYLRRWDEEMSASQLQRARRLVLPVGAFYQVQTYLRLLPTLLPEDRCQLGDGDVRWLQRCLVWLDEHEPDAG